MLLITHFLQNKFYKTVVVSSLSTWLLFVGIASAASPSEAFSETLFNQDETLSSEKLMTLVLQRNPDIQAAESASLVARERIIQAGALDDPIVKYGIAPRTFSNSEVGARHSIAFSQRLPWSGKRKLKQDRARFKANASEENVKLSQLKLTEMAKLSFANWYFVHAAIRINKHNQSLLDEFRQIAGIKYSAGKVTKQDVLQADLEFLLLQKRDITLHRQSREIQSSLNSLLNRSADAFVPVPDSIGIQAITPNQEQLLVKSLNQRPELRVLKQRIAAEYINIQLADKANYPDFTVNALYNGVMDPAEKRLQISVAMNIPFGEKLRAKKRESQARLKQLQWQQQSIINNIRSELQQTLDRLHESEQLLQLYKDSLLPLAHENLSAARQDYETGRGDFLSLITAEKKLSKTQLDQERILTDYYQWQAKLDRVLGGEEINDGMSLFGEVNILSIDVMGEQS